MLPVFGLRWRHGLFFYHKLSLGQGTAPFVFLSWVSSVLLCPDTTRSLDSPVFTNSGVNGLSLVSFKRHIPLLLLLGRTLPNRPYLIAELKGNRASTINYSNCRLDCTFTILHARGHTDSPASTVSHLQPHEVADSHVSSVFFHHH